MHCSLWREFPSTTQAHCQSCCSLISISSISIHLHLEASLLGGFYQDFLQVPLPKSPYVLEGRWGKLKNIFLLSLSTIPLPNFPSLPPHLIPGSVKQKQKGAFCLGLTWQWGSLSMLIPLTFYQCSSVRKHGMLGELASSLAYVITVNDWRLNCYFHLASCFIQLLLIPAAQLSPAQLSF